MKRFVGIGVCFLLSLSAMASRKALHKAIEVGDLAAVKAELADGTNLNREYKDQLPLISAIDLQHREMIEALIDNGADLNSIDSQDWTPLLAGLRTLDLDLVQYLIEKGADVSFEKGFTPPLHYASSIGDISLIELLRSKGADVNTQDDMGETALYAAIRKGALSIVKHLVQVGADVNHTGEGGRTPLIEAVRYHDIAMVKLLIGLGADKQAKDKTSKNALTWTALNGKPDMIALLTGIGVDRELKDHLGNNPIGYVTFFNASQKKAAMVNPLEAIGDGFHQAMFLDDSQTLQQLLSGDFSFDAMDRPPMCSSNTQLKYPTIFAIKYGSLDNVKMMFEHGAPVNGVKANIETTPLLQAVAHGRVDLVRYLLARGADTERCSTTNLSPLALAVRTNHIRIAGLLWNAGARVYGNGQDGGVLRFEDGDFNFVRLKREDKVLNKQLARHEDGQVKVCTPKDEVYTESCDDTEKPVFTKRVSPIYPKLALSKGIGGVSVTIAFILDKDGETIRDLRIIESYQDYRFGFEFYAIAALKQWEYKPGTRNGKPVDFRATVKIDFKL